MFMVVFNDKNLVYFAYKTRRIHVLNALFKMKFYMSVLYAPIIQNEILLVKKMIK
jgi:hypothetical protein